MRGNAYREYDEIWRNLLQPASSADEARVAGYLPINEIAEMVGWDASYDALRKRMAKLVKDGVVESRIVRATESGCRQKWYKIRGDGYGNDRKKVNSRGYRSPKAG